MDNYLDELIKTVRSQADTKDAEYFKKYLRNKFDFLGIRSPKLKLAIKKYYAENGKPEYKNIKNYVTYLWELPEREFQHIALLLAETYKTKLQISDIDIIEYMIENKSWWDTVDGVTNLSGAYFEKFPEQINKITEKWINSENFWFKRSAILFQLKYKDNTDFELLGKYIKLTAADNEFFIRKAIGWALRQYSKINPETVKKFVEENKLSPLSRKEALKIINKKIL